MRVAGTWVARAQYLKPPNKLPVAWFSAGATRSDRAPFKPLPCVRVVPALSTTREALEARSGKDASVLRQAIVLLTGLIRRRETLGVRCKASHQHEIDAHFESETQSIVLALWVLRFWF
jgi:hypothetical protein